MKALVFVQGLPCERGAGVCEEKSPAGTGRQGAHSSSVTHLRSVNRKQLGINIMMTGLERTRPAVQRYFNFCKASANELEDPIVIFELLWLKKKKYQSEKSLHRLVHPYSGQAEQEMLGRYSAL